MSALQHTVVHLEIGAAPDNLRFQLELDNTDCFVHLAYHAQRLGI